MPSSFNIRRFGEKQYLIQLIHCHEAFENLNYIPWSAPFSSPAIALDVVIFCNDSAQIAEALAWRRGTIRPVSHLQWAICIQCLIPQLAYFFNYYCKLALCNIRRTVRSTRFCRNRILKSLHAGTHTVCDHEKKHGSHPTDHGSHIEYVWSVRLTLGKHTHLSVTWFILQGKNKSLFSAQVGLRIINPSVWPSSWKHFVLIWVEATFFSSFP